MSNQFANSWRGLLAVAALAGTLGGCASFPGVRTAEPVIAIPLKEPVYLRVEPFGAGVVAELNRAGIDPAVLREEFVSELRYGLFLRERTESLDSAGATVVTVRVNALQPGFGTSGTSAQMTVVADPPGRRKPETLEWSWRTPASANPPAMFARRHLARKAAGEVLDRLQVPKDYEPPPPLHLMR